MAESLATIASIIGSVGVIGGIVGVCVNRAFKQINTKIDDIKDEMKKKDVQDCRVQLNSFLNKVENNQEIDEEEWQLYHAMYDHYIEDLHKNSYIHDKWNRIINKR